jgi:hypothetical protein
MVLPPLELFSLRKELPCCRAALSVFWLVFCLVTPYKSPITFAFLRFPGLCQCQAWFPPELDNAVMQVLEVNEG